MENYDAGHYYPMRLEFHKDEKTYYHIFELGNELKKNYMLVNTVTGMMELMTQAYGRNNVIMTVDFDHILRINERDVEYKPLTGDAYEYSYTASYYPGQASDFVDSQTVYEYTTDYGISDYNINYFYSGRTVNDSISYDNLYDFSIDITPYQTTSEMVIKDSRYQIAHFYLNADIYGYTHEKGNLYIDTYSTRGIMNSGLRERVIAVNGKSFHQGESVDLENLYKDISDKNHDFSKVSYTAYATI